MLHRRFAVISSSCAALAALAIAAVTSPPTPTLAQATTPFRWIRST